MNETPRLRSAFPSTPRTEAGLQPPNGNESKPSPITRPVKTIGDRPLADHPVIPLDLVDAASQRFYVTAFYIALTAWRLWDSYQVTDDLDSTWLFLKWIGIDAAFFVALPGLRIPWLEWSFGTTLTTWLLHAVANAFLMFKIPIPIMTWLAALLRIAYDRELAISEHRVKPADILRNSSIILGKQIIQILPEGSAILNPDKLAFCLDASTPAIDLPIQINQTTPISIELVRYDLDSDEVETIVISGKQARALKKRAEKGYEKSDTNTPRTLQYPVSKKGLYRLQRVIDQSKLDVRKRSFDVAVVPCPYASLSAGTTDKCTGDLSGLSLHVTGVAPFRVKYSKKINHQQFSSIVQSVQSVDYTENFGAEDGSANIVADPQRPQMGWTRTSTVSVDVNESLHQNGSWIYSVEEVEDGLGNKVVYDPSQRKDPAHAARIHSLMVHNRPKVNLAGCDAEHFLRVAKEDSVNMPVRIRPAGQLHPSDWPLKLKYTFTPETGDGIPAKEEHVYEMTNDRSLPRISKAGTYNIDSIDSRFCHGEVAEPSSCLLFNPPQPSLTLESEDIFDKCAGNPIGMLVNLDFTGTPPFKVRYTVTHRGSAFPKVQEFNSMRGQLEFRERSAGSYTYQILEIEDDVYGPISLKDKGLILQQDIKPPASAMFRGESKVTKACLGQPVSLKVKFSGEGPWDLDYEIVHAGKRRKLSVHSDQELYEITLPEQSEGGKYSVILTGVQDKSRCRTALKEERDIEVRPERPRAAFGDIEGRRSILALEGKPVKLPLRLKGLGPWTVRIQNHDDRSVPSDHVFRDANSVLSVDRPGTYELVSVHDSCPGLVDPTSNLFTVSWIPRPALSVKDSTVEAEGGQVFRKAAVCQGDESTVALILTGTPPYHLKYQQKFEPLRGPAAISNKPLSLAGNHALISMDTTKAGEYTYIFDELSDDRYIHDKRGFTPLLVKQHVYPPPSAQFSNPGKTYGYCKEDPNFAPSTEAETENIPITLTGSPPFSIEIAITHHGTSPRAEIARVKDILSTSYSWSLSRATLDLGAHTVSIRSVKDGRGCESVIEQDPSSVRISVSSPPTIIPFESKEDYCVGEHVTFSLSGQAPFEVFYNFQNRERRARVTSNEFRRIAESPGEFIITAVSDSAMGNGKCRARKEIKKSIHPFPSVKISQGKTQVSDIHEGGEVEILFEFTGTPPFEFT